MGASSGPIAILFDVTLTGTPTRIASRNAAADVAATTPIGGGFLQIPYVQAGLGIIGKLAASKNNTGIISITIAPPDTTVTNTTNANVVNSRSAAYGTLTLAAGEQTAEMDQLDLYVIQVSSTHAGDILHVSGTR